MIQKELPPQSCLSSLPLLFQFSKPPLLQYPKYPPRHPKYPTLKHKITCFHLRAFQTGPRLAAWSPSSTSTIFIQLLLQVAWRLGMKADSEMEKSLTSTSRNCSLGGTGLLLVLELVLLLAILLHDINNWRLTISWYQQLKINLRYNALCLLDPSSQI